MDIQLLDIEELQKLHGDLDTNHIFTSTEHRTMFEKIDL